MQKPRRTFLHRLWHFMCTVPLVPAYTILAFIFILSMVALFAPILVKHQVVAAVAGTATAIAPRPTPTPAWTLVSPFPTQPVPTPLANGQQEGPVAQPSALTQLPTPSPAVSAPTQPVATSSVVAQGGTWTTTQTFTGSGQKGTPTFSISNDWKLLWSCTPGGNTIGEYNMIIFAHDASNTSISEPVINDMCKAGNTQGETEVHDNLGGSIYLDIVAGGSYTLTVQELR